MIHSSALRFPKRPSSAFRTAKQSAPRTEYRLNLLSFKHSGRDPLESKRRKRKGLHMYWIMALVSNLILVGVPAAPQTRVPQPWDVENNHGRGSIQTAPSARCCVSTSSTQPLILLFVSALFRFAV